MDDKTRALVEAAETRARNATDGDWCGIGPRVEDGFWTLGIKPSATARYQDATDADHEFLIHARQDVLALCPIVREQDAQIERLRARIAQMEADEEDRRLDRMANDRKGCE